MKQLLIFFGVLVAMMLTAWWLGQGGRNLRVLVPSPTPAPPGLENTLQIGIGQTNLAVEIADSPEETSRGLSGRDNLPAEQGMLFVLEKNSRPVFWMKNMRFPIDIIWIDNNKVVGVNQSVPIPKLDDFDRELIRYPAPTQVDYVLEVNAGFAKKQQIVAGTAIVLPESLK